MSNIQKGLKYDGGKLRWDLLPMDVIEECVKILTFGAAKYTDNSWQQVENGIERYYAAMLRHIVAYRNGDTVDEESGMPHLSHALCNIVFLIWLEKQKQLNKK